MDELEYIDRIVNPLKTLTRVYAPIRSRKSDMLLLVAHAFETQRKKRAPTVAEYKRMTQALEAAGWTSQLVAGQMIWHRPGSARWLSTGEAYETRTS